MRREIRLAGFGGQGIILAGHILGKAAALYDNKDAVLSQSYGPEARGGACAAEIVISDEPVDYPLFDKADVVVVMSLEASQKYGPTVKNAGTVLVDSDLAHFEMEGPSIHTAPFTRTAQGLGNRMAANVVMLGFLTGITGIVSREAMEESVRTSVRPRFVDLNVKAFQCGYDLAKEPEAVL